MISNVAVGVGEIGPGGAPVGRVGLLIRNVARDRATGKLPHPDPRIAPLHGHDTPAIIIEGLAVGIILILDTAAGIIINSVVAVLLLDIASLLAAGLHVAAVGGVEGHLVAVVGLVCGLHDVDLAIVGPVVVVGEPEGGPGGAAVGGVLDVEEEEAAVPRGLGGDADGEAACGGVGLVAGADGGVYAEDGGV